MANSGTWCFNEMQPHLWTFEIKTVFICTRGEKKHALLPLHVSGLNILIQRVSQQSRLNNACPRQWECFPAGAEGLTGCGEILDLSEMSSPPPPAMWNIWLLIMSLFPIVLSLLHVRIHPSPAELIKELEMMLQLSAIAQRLSESLVIWSAAGNHPPLTLSEAFWGCFVVFKWVFWHIVVFVPLGFLFLDESFPSAERRSLSTWLRSSA